MPRAKQTAVDKLDDNIAQLQAEKEAIEARLAKKEALLHALAKKRREAWHLRIGKLADACGLYDWPEETLRQAFTEVVDAKKKGTDTEAGTAVKVQRNGTPALVEVGA